jgi:hypothetical protein
MKKQVRAGPRLPVLFSVVIIVGLNSISINSRLSSGGILHLCFLPGDVTVILLCIPASIRSKFPSIDVMIDSVDAALFLLLSFGFFFPELVVVYPSSSVSNSVLV